MHTLVMETKIVAMQLNMAMAGVNPFTQPAHETAGPTKLDATGIDKCILTKTVGPLIDGVTGNVTNLYKKYAVGLAIVCIVIAAFMSLADKGGKWFQRAAVIIAVFAVLGALSTNLSGVGGKSGC